MVLKSRACWVFALRDTVAAGVLSELQMGDGWALILGMTFFRLRKAQSLCFLSMKLESP